jgi:hypothetical protein
LDGGPTVITVVVVMPRRGHTRRTATLNVAAIRTTALRMTVEIHIIATDTIPLRLLPMLIIICIDAFSRGLLIVVDAESISEK